MLMAETLLCSLMLLARGSAGRAVGSVPWAVPRTWIHTHTAWILGLAEATITNRSPDLGESGEDQICGLGSEFVS